MKKILISFLVLNAILFSGFSDNQVHSSSDINITSGKGDIAP